MEILSKRDSNTLKQLRNRIQHTRQLNIVLGAGDVWYGHDWISTNQEDLDILIRDDWEFFFGDRQADNIVAEHVWEHFDEKQAITGLANVFSFLKKGANFRIAVPDGFFPDAEYIEHVRPGGIGAGADDHKFLYTHETFLEMLHQIPFRVELLEYWDEQKRFNYIPSSADQGVISRSALYDERNDFDPNCLTSLRLKYTSLIADCKK